MANVARAASNVLIRGELFEISSEGRIVRCRVRVPARTVPAAGAEAAKAVLVAPTSPALFDQFAELARRVAPAYGCVTADPDEAIASLTRLR